MKNRPREMDEFLTDPRIARISSINQDGSPHIIPVVYLFFPEKGTFYFNTKIHTLTIKNFRRNPQASVCIDDGVHPFRAVTVSGVAYISEEMGTDHEGQKMLVDHFYGPEMWADWVKSPRAQEIRVRVTIEPKKWKWWDQRRKISGSVIL
ncbi:MAG: pyridoxamine 5'-phosphate oxidase family protein [Nitrospinota bacterium]|nr:pyridoxamine 5'-phosphate oxidase family protein [Nitrospinota bacterium]